MQNRRKYVFSLRCWWIDGRQNLKYHTVMNTKKLLSWLLRIATAAILLQTLYFKFSAHPQSVELFSKLGVEPWGRIGTGVIELVTGILLLIPATAFIGAFLGIGLMAGAIMSHLTVIGIESHGDGGLLFGLALAVFVMSAVIMILHRQQGEALYRRVVKS